MRVVNIFTFPQCERYVIIYVGFTLGLGLEAFKESSLELAIGVVQQRYSLLAQTEILQWTMVSGQRIHSQRDSESTFRQILSWTLC